MAGMREFFTRLLLLVAAIGVVHSKYKTKLENLKGKHRTYHTRSKIKIDKGNPWPFLPSPGTHYSAFPGYSGYPFLILAPPDKERDDDKNFKDEQGSKYYTSRRQSVAYPQGSGAGYVPVYYMVPPYLSDQSSYTNYYQLYQGSTILNQQYLPYAQAYDSMQSYNWSPFFIFKRSNAKKPHSTHRGNKPTKRQFVPRHHWSFSQWPFDSHEYAFTKDPIYSSNVPHLPRWGPREWGGTGVDNHWAVNREGLPSPFGIGLAPHMGGQGYVGLGGRWPSGHGYPLPTNFPKPPQSQHFGFP